MINHVFLDEFVDAVFKETGILFSTSSIHRGLQKIGYTLLVIQEKAREANEAERLQFRNGLRFLCLKHPNQALLIDETHKDHSACRRRRAYGRKGENLELSSWFANFVRYTMIGAANIYGFIPEACEIIRRDGKQV